jgi:hypothetical protein
MLRRGNTREAAIWENLGLDKPKTLTEMMLEAGYEQSTAHQQTRILSGIKDKLSSIVKAMVDLSLPKTSSAYDHRLPE